MFDLGKFGVALELDTKGFDTDLKNAEKRIKKSSRGLGDFAKGVGKIVAGLGVFKLVEKGFSMITGSIDRAISRVDTLKQFPQVLQQMGYGADEAEKATKRLVDGIDGLPTTLDGITGDVQRMVNVFQDVDLATESTIALNNAFLSSGASQDQASRGLDQYIKMLSTGKVNMQSWQTLQETMPYALQETAEAFEFTGKTAQADFYEALKEGDITMDEFNAKVIELSETQGGFADIALDATKGIETSWTNIKTAIANGVANSISAFDDWFESKGFGGISGVLDNIKVKVGEMFGRVNETIPKVLDWFDRLYKKVSESKSWATFKELIQSAIDVVTNLWQKFEDTGVLEVAKEIFIELAEILLDIDFVQLAEDVFDFLERWSPLIAGIAGGVIAFNLITGAISLWSTVTAIATGIGTAFATVIAFITSPIGIAVVAIGLLVTAGVALYKNWDVVKEKLEQLWESVKKFFSKIGEFIGDTWDKTTQGIKNFINNTKQNFNNLLSNIRNIFNNIRDAIMTPINTARDRVANTISSLVNSARDRFNSMKTTVTNIFNRTRDAIVNPIEKARDKIKSIVDRIKGFFSNMKLSLPKINMPKLPKFSLKGKFSIMPPSVPKLGIK